MVTLILRPCIGVHNTHYQLQFITRHKLTFVFDGNTERVKEGKKQSKEDKKDFCLKESTPKAQQHNHPPHLQI